MNDTYVRHQNRTLTQIAVDIGDLQEQIKALSNGEALPNQDDGNQDDGNQDDGNQGDSNSSFFERSGSSTGASPAIALPQDSNVNGLYLIVRNFAIKAKPWTQAVRYYTKPDEAYDLTLVSRRIYGTPDEYIAVMAAAGLDSVENGLGAKELVLPTLPMLAAMKARVGYRNTEYSRSNGY